MKLKTYLKNNTLYLDGAMGTLLQSRGLKPGQLPERLNLTHPQLITDIHTEYYDAGANVVVANTFGANSLKFDEDELERVIKAAIDNAKAAKRASKSAQPKWIALDVGPTGRLIAPYGDLDFEQTVEIFALSVRLGAKHGADMVFIETMNDGYETKAALLAAKENCDLPVMVSNAYGESGRLMSGASPEAMIAMLEGMGADAIGVNCSFGPEQLSGVVEKYLESASVPVLFKPNAGLPRVENGITLYDVDEERFASQVAGLVHKGVRIVGGCCGTTPEYIRKLVEATRDIAPIAVTDKNITCVSSARNEVRFASEPILIGERINPTGKKRLKEALRSHDLDYVYNEAIAQAECGAHVLDVNVGLPELDEKSLLTEAVVGLQSVVALPLQIDTASADAMESALRRYNGKAMINSVSGKVESMESVFPLVKKYGGVVVALTLDESGIPASAEGRVAIAKKILATAKRYGIAKKNIVFDPLALTVSADADAGTQTLRAVGMIRRELGCHVSLGVSNVSFGLPKREIINSAFFTLALYNGLSAAIMNPNSVEMMKAYRAYLALSGKDVSCARYIEFAERLSEADSVIASPVNHAESTDKSPLRGAIIKGLKERAAELTARMLESEPAMEIVQNEIIPALNTVGEGFENKTVFLPQLLMSAEAAKSSFERIKASSSGSRDKSLGTVVLATVKGDIHDIGKNIVKLLLENYGFTVVDLGRDVEPELVVSAVERYSAPLVGLSALMTTTVAYMEQTVKLLRERAPQCKVVVGGAVLTKEYAMAIGADRYAADAMETVRYAQEVFGAR